MTTSTGSKRIIVLSDIHIGTNQDTNWYNDKYHGPYLATILHHIRSRALAGEVQELIFLGDLFDQWMYVPEVQPPTISDIVKANKNIFGPVADQEEPEAPHIGPLRSCIKSVVDNGGKVSYVRGNHDMMVTKEEITAIDPHINFVEEWVYVPDDCDNQVVCTHGHIFSMFCAPDHTQYPANLEPLPVGHFVSRISAMWCVQNKLKGWYDKSSGNPNGMIFDSDALLGIFEEILVKGEDRVAELIIGALLEAVDYSPYSGKTFDFTLRDGSKINSDKVGPLYDMLWQGYPTSTKLDKSLFGDFPCTNALFEVDGRSNLEYFVGELLETYTVVAMGHTHSPVDKEEKYMIYSQDDGLYVNSGFVCPAEESVEDGDKAPSFSEITIDHTNGMFSTSVYKCVQADGQYRVGRAEGPISIPFR